MNQWIGAVRTLAENRMAYLCRRNRNGNRLAVLITIELSAIPLHDTLQAFLRTNIGFVSVIGTIELAGEAPVRIAIVAALRTAIVVAVQIAFQAVQVVVGTARRAVWLGRCLERRHDRTIVSEKCHRPPTMQKYNFRLNGTLR